MNNYFFLTCNILTSYFVGQCGACTPVLLAVLQSVSQISSHIHETTCCPTGRQTAAVGMSVRKFSTQAKVNSVSY